MKTLHQKRSRCTCIQSSTAHVRIWVTMISKFLLVILLLHVVNRHCIYTYMYNWVVLMALLVDPFSSMKCVLTYFRLIHCSSQANFPKGNLLYWKYPMCVAITNTIEAVHLPSICKLASERSIFTTCNFTQI